MYMGTIAVKKAYRHDGEGYEAAHTAQNLDNTRLSKVRFFSVLSKSMLGFETGHY